MTQPHMTRIEAARKTSAIIGSNLCGRNLEAETHAIH
jgi:hypothetical protein